MDWVSGIIFLLLEKESKYVRFHAIQSIVVFGAISLAHAVLDWIPIIGLVLGILLCILAFVLWIVLMVKAGSEERYKIKWAGDFAEKRAE